MKKVFIAFIILCFAQVFVSAQTAKNSPAEDSIARIKSSFLQDKSKRQTDYNFTEIHRKEFADFLNKKPQRVTEEESKENAKAETEAAENSADEESDEKESVIPPEKIKHQYEVQFNHSIQGLTGNYGVWQISSLFFKRKSADRKILWGQYRVSERRSFRDQEVIAGIYKPLGKKWAFTAEGMYSPTKNFVGGFSAMGEVEKVFKGGWVGHLGARYTSYTTVKATTSYALVEKYWGNNRLANTIYITHLSNAGTAPSYRVQYNRYYGERVNSFGAAVSFGREHENIGPPTGILRANTWSISGSVRHWVTESFGISVDALLHRQGDIYYRRGLNFGARYRF